MADETPEHEAQQPGETPAPTKGTFQQTIPRERVKELHTQGHTPKQIAEILSGEVGRKVHRSTIYVMLRDELDLTPNTLKPKTIEKKNGRQQQSDLSNSEKGKNAVKVFRDIGDIIGGHRNLLDEIFVILGESRDLINFNKERIKKNPEDLNKEEQRLILQAATNISTVLEQLLEVQSKMQEMADLHGLKNLLIRVMSQVSEETRQMILEELRSAEMNIMRDIGLNSPQTEIHVPTS